MKKLMWVCCLVALWGCGEKSVLAPDAPEQATALSQEKSLASTDLGLMKKVQGKWEGTATIPYAYDPTETAVDLPMKLDISAGMVRGMVDGQPFQSKLLPPDPSWAEQFPGTAGPISFHMDLPNFREISPGQFVSVSSRVFANLEHNDQWGDYIFGLVFLDVDVPGVGPYEGPITSFVVFPAGLTHP